MITMIFSKVITLMGQVRDRMGRSTLVDALRLGITEFLNGTGVHGYFLCFITNVSYRDSFV